MWRPKQRQDESAVRFRPSGCFLKSMALSLCLSVSVSLSLCLYVFHSLSLSLSVSLSLSISLSPSLCLYPSLCIPLSPFHPLCWYISLSLFLPSPLPHLSIPLPVFPSLYFSHPHVNVSSCSAVLRGHQPACWWGEWVTPTVKPCRIPLQLHFFCSAHSHTLANANTSAW